MSCKPPPPVRTSDTSGSELAKNTTIMGGGDVTDVLTSLSGKFQKMQVQTQYMKLLEEREERCLQRQEDVTHHSTAQGHQPLVPEVVPPGKMFSIMTALVSPKVVETLEGRKDVLFQTLQERAGVLCVQPSHGICMLQGEWECMKKAHLVLEELCLQVQAQKTLMHNGRNGPMSKEDLQKMFGGLAGGQAADESHIKIYEEMHQRQVAYAQWAATLNHQMAAGAHMAQQMVAQMQQMEGQQQQSGASPNHGPSGRRSANNPNNNHMEPPPREDTPLNLKKDLEPPRLEKYGGGPEDADSIDGDNTLTIDMQDDDGLSSHHGGSPRRRNSGGIEDLSGGNANMKNGRPASRDPGGDFKTNSEMNGSSMHSTDSIKSEMNTLYAMTQALANKSNSLRGNSAKYAEPKAGMTAEGMLSEQLMASVLPPYIHQFRAAQNSPAPEDMLRPPYMSHNYRMAAVEMLERRMHDSQGKVVEVTGDLNDKERCYTPDRQKTYTTTPIMAPKDRGNMGGAGRTKELAGWPPRPPGLGPPPMTDAMDDDYGDDQYYKCSACFAGFSNADALQEHMMTAHAVGPGLTADKTANLVIAPTADAYCCPVCGKFYKSSQRLREHIPLHDKNYQRPTYPCPACHKTFTYRHNMKVHYQKIHKGREPPKRHECTICGQKFHKPVYLRNHLLRHKDHVPDTSAMDYTMAPSPHPLPAVSVMPSLMPRPADHIGSVVVSGGGVTVGSGGIGGGSTESIAGEDTSASGSPGTTTSE